MKIEKCENACKDVATTERLYSLDEVKKEEGVYRVHSPVYYPESRLITIAHSFRGINITFYYEKYKIEPLGINSWGADYKFIKTDEKIYMSVK